MVFRYRVPRALALCAALAHGEEISPATPDEIAAMTYWDDPDEPRGGEADETAAALAAELAALRVALRKAEGITGRSAWVGNVDGNREAIERDLAELSLLADLVIGAADRAHALAVHAHRLANPVEAADEARCQEISTPLHEREHADARSLDRCPSCGNALESDDRTFDGSFCEGCRTAWYTLAK
jgi:hypothetical protein